MFGSHPFKLKSMLYMAGALSLLLVALAACGTAQQSSSTPTPKAPITIGVSLSNSGDFQADGMAFEQGYQLWADAVNKNGGLLGHQVKLDILHDASDPNQVTTNYQQLIGTNKDDLVFGPFSSLLTKPASVVASRFKYLMLEGAGGAPSVFQQGLNNVFDVSLPVANNLLSFADYLISLPTATRPTTVAYETEDDPFTQPQVDIVRAKLEAAGFKTVDYNVYPAETTDYTPIAVKAINSKAQVVVLGTMLPDATAFIQTFRQQHYNPQALIATAGPDQGAMFVQAVGAASTEGVLVPNGWYAEANNFQNAQMVQAYIAKYGGKPDDISADVAEAYSVGQVLEQAAKKINSLDNAKLIAELHGGDTFDSVQGKVKFDSTGQNTAATAFLFQWQKGNFVPVFPVGATNGSPIEFPKPQWPTS